MSFIIGAMKERHPIWAHPNSLEALMWAQELSGYDVFKEYWGVEEEATPDRRIRRRAM